MIKLDISLSYEECRKKIKNWTEGDLIDYLTEYKDNLPFLKRTLIKFVGEPLVAEAVSDELFGRTY